MSRARLLYMVGLLALAAPAPLAAQARKTRIHVVQPGESCWSIAQQIFGKGEKYRIIHRYNDLGPMPHILKPGQHIRLPGKGTGPDARVAWLQRRVRAKTPTGSDWLNARKNMGLWRLYKVTTGKGSSAGIRFEDLSSLNMRAEALLVIYGGTSARARQRRKQQGTTVLLEKGTIRGGLARMDREAGGLNIRTPSAKISLQSRSSQVEVDPKKTSIVSVYDGKARVAAAGATVQVPTDHGTFVQKGKKPAPPRRLPPAPRWDGSAREVVVLVPAGIKGTFDARWGAVKRAARYRVELSRNARFTIPIVDAVVGAGVRRFSARDLVPGTYHARVSARDRARLEGRPSRVMRVRVARLETSRRLAPSTGGILEAVGLLSLEPHEAVAGQVELSLDGGPWQPGTTPVRLRKPGLHQVRVRPKNGKVATTIKVRLLAVKGALAVPKETKLEVGGASAKVTLRTSDERGRPASLPGLTVTAWPGGPLKLAAAEAGVTSAMLPAPAAYTGEPVRLVATWAGGELGRAEVAVKEPLRPAPRPTPAPSKPAEFSWPEEPVALGAPDAGPYLPSRFALPVTHLGLGARFAGREAARGDNPIYMRLALHGELALLDGRLGLGAELPWFQTDLARDVAGDNNLGDLRLDARFVALQARGLTLAPSLRLTVPTGALPTGAAGRTVLLEPAALFQARLWRVTVGTHQALALRVGPDDDTDLTYNASYGAALRLWRLSLAAEVITLFGVSGPGGDLAAVGAGGAVRLHLDRLRISVVAGGGLNDDARQVLGNYSAGLAVDLGF